MQDLEAWALVTGACCPRCESVVVVSSCGEKQMAGG